MNSDLRGAVHQFRVGPDPTGFQERLRNSHLSRRRPLFGRIGPEVRPEDHDFAAQHFQGHARARRLLGFRNGGGFRGETGARPQQDAHDSGVPLQASDEMMKDDSEGDHNFAGQTVTG